MKKSGFTLIELLIVVAIIAILAAIAIPNLLEGKVRAKTSCVKADMKTLVTALEAYRTDNNAYINPWPRSMYPIAEPVGEKAEILYYKRTATNTVDGNGFQLTTPVAYIT